MSTLLKGNSETLFYSDAVFACKDYVFIHDLVLNAFIIATIAMKSGR